MNAQEKQKITGALSLAITLCDLQGKVGLRGQLVEARDLVEGIAGTAGASAGGSGAGKHRALKAGHDFPCSLHNGPKGACNEHNCRCY